jgi:hypothetical protein
MKEQKFIITKDQSDIQYWLDKSWGIVSVTAQHVSAGSLETKGSFAVVLEKVVIK